MKDFIEITDFTDPQLDVYARLTEAQLLNRFEPAKGMFIAESPKVIMRALDAGCEPVSLLVERNHVNAEAAEAIERCGDVPVFTATLEILTKLTGFQLTRGMLCAMRRPKLKTLEETIAGFTKGYETFVGERGVTLSGGQKQRAAIARMLTNDTPIMIFDDSLSAVDTETDAKIRRAISQRFGKASVILISHRITTLSAADKIIVLDRGRIVEEGNHEQLKTAGGIYQKIYETQSGSQEVTV